MRIGALVLAVTVSCGQPRTPGPSTAGHTFGGDSERAEGGTSEVLEAHNRLRKQHCAPALAWSKEVARVAQRWADDLAGRCVLQHSGGDLGENLAAGSEEIMDAEHTVEMWYSEVEKYDFKNGGFSMQTGHFTQLVWRDTARLGCGVSACKGLRIWVCNYDPPGNVQGEYREQVLPTSCR